MLARLANRRSRLWAVALALALNLGGGPMAWAHLAAGGGHCHTTSAPAVRADAHCPGHSMDTVRAHAQPGHPLPCCDGGACSCATPPAPAALTLAAPAVLPIHSAAATPAPHPVASGPLDDSLRPPIR